MAITKLNLTGGDSPFDPADPQTFPEGFSTFEDSVETELDGKVPSASGLEYREYDSVTGWPVRGSVPSGTIVVWVSRDSSSGAPTVDGTYALAGVDIALLAQA